MFILIGCPIYKRAWILPDWFEYITHQTVPIHDIGFAFLIAPDDTETHTELLKFHAQFPQVRCFEMVPAPVVPHQEHPPNGRHWTAERYHYMVAMRNALLDVVNVHNPDRYFSLDSDIFLRDSDTLKALYHYTEVPGVDAISPLTFMTPTMCRFPSAMKWVDQVGGFASRPEDSHSVCTLPLGTIFKADIIMAAKMMTPPVYRNVRYQWHRQGEDLGWSTAATEAGFNLYCASNVYCPHIMTPDMLGFYRQYGDQRGEQLFETPVG